MLFFTLNHLNLPIVDEKSVFKNAFSRFYFQSFSKYFLFVVLQDEIMIKSAKQLFISTCRIFVLCKHLILITFCVHVTPITCKVTQKFQEMEVKYISKYIPNTWQILKNADSVGILYKYKVLCKSKTQA